MRREILDRAFGQEVFADIENRPLDWIPRMATNRKRTDYVAPPDRDRDNGRLPEIMAVPPFPEESTAKEGKTLGQVQPHLASVEGINSRSPLLKRTS